MALGRACSACVERSSNQTEIVLPGTLRSDIPFVGCPTMMSSEAGAFLAEGAMAAPGPTELRRREAGGGTRVAPGRVPSG